MGSTFDDRERVGNEQGAERAGVAIGVNDGDWAAGVDFADGVVGIGEAEEISPLRRPSRLACCPRIRGRRWLSRRGSSRLALFGPQVANRQAAWVAVVPKRGLAIPIFPFHFGSIRSFSPFGRSASGTSFVFTMRICARAASPYHVWFLALKTGGNAAAFGGSNGASSPFLPRRSVLTTSLFQNRSQRGRSLLSGVRIAPSRSSWCSRRRTWQSEPAAGAAWYSFQGLGELAIERRIDDDPRVVLLRGLRQA